MESPPEEMRLVRFGPFEANFTTGELRKHGIRLKLQDQPFHILRMLLAHPGELVTRENIRQSLWPSGTFVDFDNGLNAAINRLREALGDSAEHPRFIETLPRRGYRFICTLDSPAPSVVEPLSRTHPVAGADEIPVGIKPSWRRKTGLVACGVAFAVLLALGTWLAFFRTSTEAARIQSLAVLPLQNLSGNREEDYFADGMTEELITNLSKITTLKVISRTSVMQYKETKKPLPQIGKELHVDAVIEGSVLRAGNRVRITVQLIQASTDRNLWAETYDRDLRDVLTLQNDVATAIGGQVQAKLTSQEQKRLASARQLNPEAYQAYLRARYFLSKWTAEGIRKCADYSQRAIDLEPTYAPAHASLASCYIWAAGSGDQLATEAFSKAKAAVGKALQLDDSLAEAHTALGQIKLQFDWDFPGAEQEFKSAAVLNPSSSTAHMGYGLFLTAMGRTEEAVKETEKALELDPLTPTTNLQLGWVLYYARRHDESITQLKKALELDPDLGYAYMELGWNYAQKQMYPEAIAECKKAISLVPQGQVVLGSCGGVYGLAGRRQDALLLLSRLQKLSEGGYVDPYNVAWLYDGLGDNDHTMAWLERAYRERSASLCGLRIETWTQGLRSDPRFADLLRRVRLPP